MRKSKFSETQIVGILQEAEAGVAVNDLLRTHGISRATFFKWRSKYGGASVSDVTRLRIYNEERPHDSLGRVPPLTFLPRPKTARESTCKVST